MMHTHFKRSPYALLSGLFLLSHPVPLLFHLLAIAMFTLLAAGLHATWSVVAYIIAAHAAMQLAINFINDYCDRARDAVGKPEKPIPRGLVRPREALILGYLMVGTMALLLLPLPPLAWGLSLLYLTLAMAYNLGLKSTPFSGFVFALAMPLIPLYAFAGVGRSIPLLVWLVPVGFLLGVALNLANSLLDLEQDAANGARTLAVALGVKRAFLCGNCLLVGGALLILGLHLTHILPIQPLILAGTLLATALFLLAIWLLTGPTKPHTTRKIYFYLVTLAAIVLAGGWLTGGLI